MGGSRNGRTREAERLVGNALDELVSVLESGGSGARDVARRTADLADGVGDRLGSSAERISSVTAESRRRASAAVDALAGRRARVPWEWIIGAAVAGAATAWIGGILIRRAAEQQLDLEDLDDDAPQPHEAPQQRTATQPQNRT